MFILLVPILIISFILISIIFFIRRSLIAGAIFLFVAIILNFYTQTIPIHPSYYFNTTQKKENSIRILSYNIKYNGEYLRNNKDSLSALIAFIQQQDADILVLPESRINSTNKTLRKKLNQIYQYHLGSKYVGNEFYLETYVFSRYPISNAKQYGDYYIYEVDINLSENNTLKLIACHLESNQSNSSLRNGEGFIKNIKKGYETRNKEAKMICDSLKQYQGPLIIAGDLNDISGSNTLNTLQKELNLSDAWWKSGFGYGATSFSKHLYFRLDHILFSHHFKSTSIEIPKIDFSDHYPIVTNIEIQ